MQLNSFNLIRKFSVKFKSYSKIWFKIGETLQKWIHVKWIVIIFWKKTQFAVWPRHKSHLFNRIWKCTHQASLEIKNWFCFHEISIYFVCWNDWTAATQNINKLLNLSTNLKEYELSTLIISRYYVFTNHRYLLSLRI